ncbi:hypothetical protein BJ875DRAFT_464138 [Amylocarpus encephaloides]|uniref:Uncharacterized protein n=1 Tax=Amylocarpus encephaloides TaxID=45428 RepID=A0A9P7YGH3_9HELO|nr:hypothetical protein BJ875DRAFT_464138 [Amylocarpus encephaloides]
MKRIYFPSSYIICLLHLSIGQSLFLQLAFATEYCTQPLVLWFYALFCDTETQVVGLFILSLFTFCLYPWLCRCGVSSWKGGCLSTPPNYRHPPPTTRCNFSQAILPIRYMPPS